MIAAKHDPPMHLVGGKVFWPRLGRLLRQGSLNAIGSQVLPPANLWAKPQAEFILDGFDEVFFGG